ncbi:tyrosine-type recombinase/integrase [Corynebacterium variabile]|uniref:tyrosine-type recombinase/integrase n=1 Tax=Corynebacterium variabile TaxID=1727 RepID=UPI003F969B49
MRGRPTLRYPTALDADLGPLLTGRPGGELVFRSLELKPLRHSNYGRRSFRPAVKAVRHSDPEFPDLTLHDLRHTAASLAIASGATPPAVQRMLGHSSAAFTLRVYTGLFDDDLESVAVKMDARISSGLRADRAKNDPHSDFSE